MFSKVARNMRSRKFWTSLSNRQHRRLNSTTTDEVPSQADVVIIGGGSIGTSTLYHLTKAGVKNAVLIEKDAITAGTTWHSAGLVWRLRPAELDIQMITQTRKIADELVELGQSPGWINNGGLFIASTKERLNEYERLQTFGKVFGIDSAMLDKHEAKELYPLMNNDDVIGCLHSPGDGTLDPTGWATSLASAACKNGATIVEKCSVTDIKTENTSSGQPRVSGVETSKGFIKTNVVVNACGSWSKIIGDMVNVNIPLCSMHHAYVVTEGIEGIASMPNIRDHDLSMYLKVSGNSLHVGGYENNPVFWDKVQKDFAFSLFDLDWDIFETHLNNSFKRVPILAEKGIQSTVCGPESFTPDHKPLMGETPEIKGFYLNCGFNSAGIMLSGGAGYECANLITKGYTENDVFSYDVTRFHSSSAKDETWIKERSHEAYAKNYSIVFPHDEPLAGRNSRKDPFYPRMVEHGCVFQERLGYERPGWFEGKSADVTPLKYDYYGNYECTPNKQDNYLSTLNGELTFDWPKSHSIVKKEVLNCRENVAVFNQSYFGKLFLTGSDSQKAMDWICTNDVRKPPGSVVYTNMLNKNGGVECDLTVTKLSEDEFYIACGGASTEKDKKWIQSIIDEKDFDCKLREETDNMGMISVQGPKSRKLLEKLTGEALDDEAFPFSFAKKIKVAGHDCLALRLTFVGEMGWELHIPKESCLPIYDALMDQGSEFNISNAGYYAIDSMSCEKGYKHWHEDLRRDDTPLEAGLGFICKLKTEVDFLGRTALENQQKNGMSKRLGCFTIEDQSEPLNGTEVLYRNGVVAGYVRRTSYSYTIEKTVAWVYVFDSTGKTKNVNLKYLREGENYEIESRGRLIPATYHQKCVYDPKNEKLRPLQ